MVKVAVQLVVRYWVLLTLLLGVIIAVLSLTPLERLPTVPGGDKIQHFIAYAALAFPVSLARPRFLWFVILGLVCFGGVIELVQPYANRFGEWADFGVNGLGVGIGLLLGFVARRLDRVWRTAK